MFLGYTPRPMAAPRDRPQTTAVGPSRRVVVAALVVALAAIVLAVGYQLRQPVRGATLPDDGDAARAEKPDLTSPIPSLDHVYVIVLENHGLASILGDPAVPYLNSLIAKYGLATNYVAVARPSQPNYIALFGGSTRGIADNDNHDLSGPNLADRLEAHGLSWRVFAQNVPSGCFTGVDASGGPDGTGTYARKHEPAISFTNISSNPSRCANIMDFSHFDPAAADFELIIPNRCNDMHDCSVDVGDRFLAGFVPRILDSPEFRFGGALFITFDEGTEDTYGGEQQVATIVAGPGVPAGFRSNVQHTHYSLLRTIEDTFGLGCLDEDCDANNMSEFFTAPGTLTTGPSASGLP
jgi:phosphatidylinositol-3-phosphatase